MFRQSELAVNLFALFKFLPFNYNVRFYKALSKPYVSCSTLKGGGECCFCMKIIGLAYIFTLALSIVISYHNCRRISPPLYVFPPFVKPCFLVIFPEACTENGRHVVWNMAWYSQWTTSERGRPF